jgi:hypothetical protein
MSAGTRVWPKANSQNGSSVPASDSAANASAGRGNGRWARHHDRQRKGDQRARAELHRGHGGGIAAGEEPGLEHDEARRHDHRRQHEQATRRVAPPPSDRAMSAMPAS